MGVGAFRAPIAYHSAARRMYFLFLIYTQRRMDMRKLLVASVVLVFGWTALSLNSRAQDQKKTTIKEVMKVCMKGGLCGKVAKGEASEEEKKKLAGLFAALHENKPPKGEQASWDAKTKALVDAANDVLAGKEGAVDRLKAAAKCADCHNVHKGK